MKFLTVIFALLLVSFSAQAATGTPTGLVLIATGPKEMVLKMDAPLRVATKLEITDSRGVVIYSDNLPAKATLARQFKLEQFATGNYELVITDELFETIYSFKVTANGIKIDTSDVRQTAFPVLSIQENTATLNYLNNEKLAVQVKIIDEAGSTIYTDEIRTRGVVMRTYDLSNLKESDYHMVVTAGRKSITKYLAL